MFQGSPSPAPDVEREALAYVLHRAFLFVRLFTVDPTMPEKERALLLSDLADALHNVPIVMERYGKGHDAGYLITLFFRSFDAKWKDVAGVPRLEEIYCSAVEAIARRDKADV